MAKSKIKRKRKCKCGYVDSIIGVAALTAGGKPGDVPRFVPNDELNTGPRDERGRLKDGMPSTVAEGLADLFEDGKLILLTNGEKHPYWLSKHDRDIVITALRDAVKVCRAVASASMSETRPARGESSIGWQRSDGVNAHEVVIAARQVVEAVTK